MVFYIPVEEDHKLQVVRESDEWTGTLSMDTPDIVLEQRAQGVRREFMDSDARKIKQKITELLDKPILPSRLNLDKAGLCTPRSQYESKLQTDRNRPEEVERPQLWTLDPKREELCRLLERGLGHIAANPSRPGNVFALKQIYTFPEPGARLPSSFQYGEVLRPNNDEESARNFVIQLADLAQANRALYEDRYYSRGPEKRDLSTDRIQLTSESKWVLVGNRGVGKTIFLNYIFVVFNEDLHDKKTIWVRIDYTKETPGTIKLKDWIRWKICHTLFRWYEAQSRETDKKKMGMDNPNWQHWKKKTEKNMVFDLDTGSEALYDRARLVYSQVTREEFEREVRDARVRILSEEEPGKVKPWLFQAIWDHLAIDHKVGFIIIIDGLDKLGLTHTDSERFNRKVDGIQSTIRTEKALAAAYVVTARHESYLLHLVEEQLKKFRLAVVLPVSAKSIWEKKKVYLQSQEILTPERFEYVTRLGQSQYQDMQDLLCNSLIAFATYALTSTWRDLEPTTDSSTGFALLERIFGENIRQLFEALAASARFLITALPPSFDRLLDSAMASTEAKWLQEGGNITFTTCKDIEHEYQRWYYRFIEALMLQSTGNEFRRDRYGYALRSGHEVAPEFALVIESRDEFLHNLFHHASAETATMRPCVLASVRAVQYARYCENVVNRETLIKFLENHFGYLGHILRLTIDQLVEAGIFQPHTGGEPIIPAELKITHRGEFLLDRLVNALEYLCLALQTAPLPRQLVRQDFFPMRPYTSETFVVDNKIVSTINFLRLLSDLEDMEEEHFNKHIADQLVDETDGYSFRDFEGKSFRLTDTMKDSVRAAINRIVDQAFRRKNKQRIAQLKDRFLVRSEVYFGETETSGS